MFKLAVVYTGLVFFAQAPTQGTFTTAVLVTGAGPEEHHARFRIADGVVTVTKDGKPVTQDSWALGPTAMVTIESSPGGLPARLANFKSHVPSVGKALVGTPGAGASADACTYAPTPVACANQNGRIRMSGGTLDASVLSTDPEYPFLTSNWEGSYWSRLSSITLWQGSVEKITIVEGGTTYELKATTDVVIEAGSHPMQAGPHFAVLRHLYGVAAADFPEPIDIYDFFRKAADRFRKPPDGKGTVGIMTIPRPILCPPATQ